MLEIRNAGSETVDLARFQLTTGTCSSSPDGGLDVVRGSLQLAPGAKALVITHADVPTNDEPRMLYENVYLARAHLNSLTLSDAGRLTLSDPQSENSVFPLGPVMTGGAVGECCRIRSGIGPPQSCVDLGDPYCDGSNPGCWVLVTKSTCCDTNHGCGWIKSDYAAGCVTGCPDNVAWECCP